MADVTYKSEPTVSVHGVPQSQYDSQMSQGQQQGGLVGNIKQHWPVWMVGIGLATIAVIYLVYRAQSNSSVNSPTGSTTDSTAGSSTPDQLWGSQLDADYQQMISSLNTNTGLLQQILTIPGTPGPPGPTGPSGQTGPSGPGATPKIIRDPNTWSGLAGNQALFQNMPRPAFLGARTFTGEHFLFEGNPFTEILGSDGRIWATSGYLTAAQAKATTIKKQGNFLIYRP
jgi:hypothetical protein